MGILDLSHKDEVRGAKVLVCALDNRFDDLLKGDAEVYGRYYRATTTTVFPGIQALLGGLEQKYDIVHLICDVSADGAIADTSGEEITGNATHSELLRSERKVIVVRQRQSTRTVHKGIRGAWQASQPSDDAQAQRPQFYWFSPETVIPDGLR